MFWWKIIFSSSDNAWVSCIWHIFPFIDINLFPVRLKVFVTRSSIPKNWLALSLLLKNIHPFRKVRPPCNVGLTVWMNNNQLMVIVIVVARFDILGMSKLWHISIGYGFCINISTNIWYSLIQILKHAGFCRMFFAFY